MWQAAITTSGSSFTPRRWGFSRCERILKHPQLRQTARRLQLSSPGPGRTAPSHGDASGTGGRRRGRAPPMASSRLQRWPLWTPFHGPQCARVTISWHLSVGFVELSCRGSGQEEGQGHGAGGPLLVDAAVLRRAARGRTAAEGVFTSAESVTANSTSTQGICDNCGDYGDDTLDEVGVRARHGPASLLPVSPTSAHLLRTRQGCCAGCHLRRVFTHGRGRRRPTETYYPASPRAAKTPWAPLQGTHYVRPHLPGPVLQRHRRGGPRQDPRIHQSVLQVASGGRHIYFFRFLIFF